MYHASLAVKLPSELPTPTPKVGQLVELLFPPPDEGNDDDPDAELRETLRTNLAVFEALLRAFEGAGFNDVVAIVVDGKPAYVDTEEQLGDLQQALEGVVKSGAVARGFAVMRTTFRRREDELEVFGELRCHARSGEREDETRVRVSARPIDHAPSDEEGPREYAARLREGLRNAEQIEARRKAVEAVRDAVAEQIRALMPDAGLEPQPAVVRLVAPGSRQLGRMRHLGFGASRGSTVSCSLPSYERVGPYDDPLSRHYYSVYADLFHWIAVGEALAGHLASPFVEVVSATGRTLFRGDESSAFDPAEFAVSRDVVRVSPDGRLRIDASVPEAAALETAAAGSPHSRGWGGEAWADGIDAG